MVDGKTLYRTMVEEVWHRGQLGYLGEAYSPSFVGNVPRGKLQDLAAYRSYVTTAQAAFPDIRIDVLGQIAEDDFTAHRFRVRGTHLGEFMGIPATGRPISVEGMTMQRLSFGRIAESWSSLDALGLLTDLDVRDENDSIERR
jgi:predicted ester cyclase